MGRRYLRGARSIKRLESIQKSPMISHFSSSLEGLSSIRAFSNTPVFINRMYGLIDAFTTASWHNWLFNLWIGFYMAMVGSFFSSSVAAFIVSTRGVDASLAGFSLAFALNFRSAAIRMVKLLASAELDMNAAERIFEYSHLETEAQGGIDNLRASWPEEGKLEIKDLEVGYAEDLPSILKGLTFKADMNQRIGVVGRTGAGTLEIHTHFVKRILILCHRKIYPLSRALPLPRSSPRQHNNRWNRHLYYKAPRLTDPVSNHPARPCAFLRHNSL